MPVPVTGTMEAALLAAGDGSVASGDGGGLTTGDTLLIVAQVLFMLLPITGMYTMRAGKPTKLVGAALPLLPLPTHAHPRCQSI